MKIQSEEFINNFKKRMMKKILFCMLTVIAVGMMASCNGCSKSEKPQEEATAAAAGYDGVVQDFTAGVNSIAALHKQTMFSLCGGKKYEWRNLQVKFSDVITTENTDSLKVVDITDVFYYWDEGPWVQYITSNVKDGTLVPARIPDVWIEDGDMSEAEIGLSAEDALARLKEWNGVVPTSQNMVLRMPVGPRRCNAQWVIGNIGKVIFIDAVTGEIASRCPAFPIPNANGPLGEWP